MSIVTDNKNTLIETRVVRFIINSINHSKNTCKNILGLRVKLLNVNSTFTANYQYVSFKYGLIVFTPLGHLLGKVKKKMLLLHPQPVLNGFLKELCAIRDNTSSCDIANNNDIVALKTYNSIFNYYILVRKSILYAKITLSPKKFVSKLSCKQTARLLFS